MFLCIATCPNPAFRLSQATTSDSAALHQQQDDWNSDAKFEGIQKLSIINLPHGIMRKHRLQHPALKFLFSSPEFGSIMVSSIWTYGHPLCFTMCPNEVKIHLRKSETLQIPSVSRITKCSAWTSAGRNSKITPLPMS